jgi:nucleoside-diphosphate-sugar epimerase
MPTVLLTGSEGYVGSSLLPHLAGVDVVTVDRKSGADVVADIAVDSDRVRRVVSDTSFDALIHLAANPDEKLPWETLYEANVVGTLRAYELARDLGMRKVIFASSVQVVQGYVERPETWPIGIDVVPWPRNAYGVGKVVGENFLQIVCDETAGTRGYALRIALYWGGRGPLRSGPHADRLFLHAEDFAEIVLRCLRDEKQDGFARFFCTSGISEPVLDISETRRALGYEPRHDAADFYE